MLASTAKSFKEQSPRSSLIQAMSMLKLIYPEKNAWQLRNYMNLFY